VTQSSPVAIQPSRTVQSHQRSIEFLGEPDELSFGPPDVTEQVRGFVLDHFAYGLRSALAEPGERIVDVSTVNMTRR
jgi:hypothetical protein